MLAPLGRPSTLNASGSPVQYALAVGPGASAVAVLVDVGASAGSPEAELERARAGVRSGLDLVGAGDQRESTLAWLDSAAPQRELELRGAEGGIAWLGAGFSLSGSPRFKVYLNQRWGPPPNRWRRLERFAEHFGAGEAWAQARVAGQHQLGPLGVALELAPGAAPAGRIYLSGYGRPSGYYQQLAGQLGGPEFQARVTAWLHAVLGDDHRYPTRSASVSIALQAGTVRDVKIELCAHCAFDDDQQAARRGLAGLRTVGLDSGSYLEVQARLPVHVYLGLGSDGRASFYFDPGRVA